MKIYSQKRGKCEISFWHLPNLVTIKNAGKSRPELLVRSIYYRADDLAIISARKPSLNFSLVVTAAISLHEIEVKDCFILILVPCPAGSFSLTGLAPCSLCDRRSFQPNNESRICIPCPGTTVTVRPGSKSAQDCIGT